MAESSDVSASELPEAKVDPSRCPQVTKRDERPAFDFRQLSEYGVLWLINRCVFHPRGFALALEYEEGNPEPQGWSIQGDGSEPWRFEGDFEDERFQQIESLLHEARAFGAVPTIGPAQTEA